jgi:hypothetical protein
LESSKYPSLGVGEAISSHAMDSADMVLHQEKYGNEKDGLILGQAEMAACDLGKSWDDSVITSLCIVVEDTCSSAASADKLGGEDLEEMSGIGCDSCLIAKLNRRDQLVVLGVVDHLAPPEVTKQLRSASSNWITLSLCKWKFPAFLHNITWRAFDQRVGQKPTRMGMELIVLKIDTVSSLPT